MPAFLPTAPLISQELLNPIISHFALLAESSANVPKRLCSLVMEKNKQKNPQNQKQQQKNPHKKQQQKSSCSAHHNTSQTTGPYTAIKLN